MGWKKCQWKFLNFISVKVLSAAPESFCIPDISRRSLHGPPACAPRRSISVSEPRV